jgi:hypothetical protein
MPRYIDTLGNATLAIFICDRCKFKRPMDEMRSDPNFPGLKVCSHGCADEKDPYRLPARKTEKITLRFPRPDVSVATAPNAIQTTGTDALTLSPTQPSANPPADGNLDTLSPSPSSPSSP